MYASVVELTPIALQCGFKQNNDESSMGAVRKKKIIIIFYNLKDLYFINISVKCIFWWIFKEIVKDQDFYRKKGCGI